ncbi:MAG: RNA polymerase sigma factor [Verrucomicrobia bacterium]|nr:RNA polymerase sigma factor [Verrucomicrobiota bacterium]
MGNLFPRSLFAITDEQAMWRVQTQDDPHAFARLVERWQGPIRNLCARMTGDLHRGEDLAQEAFARVFARRKDYRPAGKFSTYLWRIALNLCYDELRRVKRRDLVPFETDGEQAGGALKEVVADEPGPDCRMMEAERAELVRQALLKLPENHRTVVVLRHYEGLKFREIADVLAIPEGTVKSRMAEGLSQLGRWLKPRLDEEIPGRGLRPDEPRVDTNGCEWTRKRILI